MKLELIALRRLIALGAIVALGGACGRNNIYPLVAASGSNASIGSTSGSTGESTGASTTESTSATGTSAGSDSSSATATGSGSTTGETGVSTGQTASISSSSATGTTTGTTTTGTNTSASTAGSFSSSSSSTGRVTTTGTTTTSSTSGASCTPGAPPNELQPCESPSNCICPLVCARGPLGASLCEFPCTTLADCPNLETVCSGGTCQPDFCGPDAGNGTLDSICNVAGAGGGSCLPSTFGGLNVGLCSQSGPADAGCLPTATRSQIGQACLAGEFCAAALDSTCAVLCDPFSFESCGLGAVCQTLTGQDPRLGVCEPTGTTTSTTTTSGSTSGTTGTSGTGTTTGGSSSGTTSGGCSTSIPPSEFQACQDVEQCGCPMTCSNDSAAGGQVCEYPCLATSDCPDLITTCQDGVCAVNQCGGDTGNGTFDGPCNVFGTGDGTCEPLTLDGGLSSVGYCYQAGSASGSCDPSASRITAASQICPPGYLCFGGVETFGGTCSQLCVPPDGFCASQTFETCSAIVNEPDLGICISGF